MIVRTIRFGLLVSILTAIGHASPASAAAILSVTPTSLTLQANTGSNVANRLVTVSKTGNGVRNWSVVAPTATWLTVSPTSGKDAGTLTLTFRTSALAAGTYQTSFAVKSSSGSSVTVTVKVTMVASSTTTPTTSTATTFYVSTTGADTNPGTQSSPVRTIQKAVSLANTAQRRWSGLARGDRGGNLPRNRRSWLPENRCRTHHRGRRPQHGPDRHGRLVNGLDRAGRRLAGALSGRYQWGMKAVPSGWTGYWNWDGNGYKRDVLRRSEMIYVNGSPLRGVLTRAELSAAGTFYVDEGAAKLYMRLPAGISLTGSTVEVGMRVNVLKMSGRRNVTLRNFSVLRSRGGLQDTAVLINSFAQCRHRECASPMDRLRRLGGVQFFWRPHHEISIFRQWRGTARDAGAASAL